jgi:predicted CopG family antitoxin
MGTIRINDDVHVRLRKFCTDNESRPFSVVIGEFASQAIEKELDYYEGMDKEASK